MLYSSLHIKKYTEAHFDVAHLYEHLAISGFYDFLAARGINSGVSGYVNGETFEGIIFLQTLFYQKSVSRLYEQFLQRASVFSEPTILQALSEISAEDKKDIRINNESALQKQLHALASLPWSESSGTVPSRSKISSPLSKHSTKDFLDVTLGIYGERQDLKSQEEILFLRLSVILHDIIRLALRQELQVITLNCSPPQADALHIGITQTIRLHAEKRPMLQPVVQQILNFNVENAMPAMHTHFQAFAQQTAWRDMPIDYFRYTDILTTNQNIAKLATYERITSLLSKLKVRVHT